MDNKIYVLKDIDTDKVLFASYDRNALETIMCNMFMDDFHRKEHLCICIDVMNYIPPINFNQFVKSDRLKECENIHKMTIDDNATIKARKRGRKL